MKFRQKFLKFIRVLFIFSILNIFYVLFGIWPHFLRFAFEVIDRGDQASSFLSLVFLVLVTGLLFFLSVKLYELFWSKPKKIFLFLLILLFVYFLPIIYFDFGPGRLTCYTDSDCVIADYKCCRGCSFPQPIKAVNKYFRKFRKRLNFCFRVDCPLVTCVPSDSLSGVVIKCYSGRCVVEQ